MSKFDEIQKKARALKLKRIESSQELAVNMGEIVKDIKTILASNKDGGEALLSYLEKKDIETSENDSENNKNFKALITTLHELAKQLGKPAKGLTQTDIKNAFDKSLQAIEKILVNQNEKPSRTIVTKEDGRLKRIFEQYENFSLTYNYTWSSEGGYDEKVVKKYN